jgi:hypothetical protein
MRQLKAFLLLTISLSNHAFGQHCNCQSNFEWVKKTFEENDAGFLYVIGIKGKEAYLEHNRQFLEKVKQAKTRDECGSLLYDWMTFFRPGHIAIRMNDNNTAARPAAPTPALNQFPHWETASIDIEKFENYLGRKKEADFEGIWETPPYTIGISKEGDAYVGFIIESGADTWKKGQVKLKITPDEKGLHATFYLRDHSAVASDDIHLTGKNHLQIGQFELARISPVFTDEKKIADYYRLLASQKPYVETLNSTTLYLRIPSFQQDAKKDIDSVLAANRAKILATENLILDIRSGQGGSDVSYEGILPFLYTDPIRTVGLEFLSTPLNNQRMLDFIDKPEYGFNDEEKKWARESYDKLQKHLGQFINLDTAVVGIQKYDTVYPYPRSVGIIINNHNGSTDEQFLLAAKQSRKVKLFGTTTFGELDISNMYFVPSPCNEFTLGYSLSRSMRIPGMTIDGKGIQPDYYLDTGIPDYEWVEFVSTTLNEK